MSRNWRWILPCYLWTLPMTIVGFALASLVYRASSWQWRDGVLTCVAGTSANGVTLIWGRPNAQTLGWIQVYDSPVNREFPDLRVHENVHVAQAFASALIGVALVPLLFMAIGWSPLLGAVLGGFVGGLMFAILYGLLFVYLWVKGGGGDWYDAYRDNPFEVQAYNLQDRYIANPSSRPWGV